MKKFDKVIHNPLELIQLLWKEGVDSSHITYDPDMKNEDRDYYVIRQTGHDGTLYFTYEMYMKAFIEILNKQAYCVSRPPEFEKLKDIRYTVGPIKHSVVYGKIKLGCSEDRTYPGMKERVRMAVKVEYIY